MSKVKHYGGIVLGVGLSLLVLNQLLKMVAPSIRGYLGLAG